MTAISDQAESLAAAGQVAEALQLLSNASRAGDPNADFTLGIWLLSGQYVRRKLAHSREAFRRAAAAGHARAAAIYIAFVANGTGAPPDWPEALRLLRARAGSDDGAARQLALIEKMDLAENGRPKGLPSAQKLVPARVESFRGLFSSEECLYLAEAATPLLEPSVVVDPHTGRQIRDPIRTSDVAAFPLALEDPAIHALNVRLACASGTDVRQGEPLQVLRYRIGQEFKPHVDTLPFGDNQRIRTALVGVNEGYSGGETLFLELDLQWKGAPGDALIFSNVAANGRPDPQMRHAGLPITAGEKMLASRWIRAHSLDLGDNP